MIDPSISDPSNIARSLREIASKIERVDRNGAQRLHSLADAVVKGVSADDWIASDIYKTIDPDSIVESFKSQEITTGNFIEILKWMRYTLILVPVVFTVYGISQAIQKYVQLTEAHSTLISLPFLYIWENGFNGLLPIFLTFSNILFIDTSLIFCIIVITGMIYMQSTQIVRREREARRLHDDIVHALAGASLSLQQSNRLRRPPTVTDNLDGVARDLQAMLQQIAKSFDQVASDVTTQFKQVTQQMYIQTQEGGQYLTSLGELASNANQLANTIQSEASSLQKITQNFAASLQQNTGFLATSVIDLRQHIQTIITQQNQLLQALNSSVTEFSAHNKSLHQLIDEQKKFSELQADSSRAIDISAQYFVNAVEGMRELNDEQKKFLMDLQADREGQEKLAAYMNSAATSMRNALQEWQEGTLNLRRIAVDTNDVLRLYAALPKSLPASIDDIMNPYLGSMKEAIESYARTANSIAASCQALDRSTTSIYLASNALTEAISEQKQISTS